MKAKTRFKLLEKKAGKYWEKHNSVCAQIFELISPMLDFPLPDENDFVMRQIGDGYVYVNIDGRNVPVDKIIQLFESEGKLITEDDLKEMAI